MNRLQESISPYLNSLAEDCVDWYPWGKEAFDRAKQEQKPMRIVIGTGSTLPHPFRSHSTVARLTERYFIPVQVDGEEHPHVAAMYIRAASMLAGRSRLPLEVLTDSQGKPFFVTGPIRDVELAGLLSGVALQWSSDPAPYARVASRMEQQLRAPAEPLPRDQPRESLWKTHFEMLQTDYDRENGGFGAGGKHLMPHELLFLLEYSQHTGELLPRQMLEHTLTKMALGAIRDHIGGGFFHSTADAQWLFPASEKRLIDQAWMLDAYTRAWHMTGEPLFRQIATETADFVIRELRHAAGGFYSAQRADADCYRLTESLVCATVGNIDGKIFCKQYAIGTEPTFPHLFRGEDPKEDSVLLHDLRMKLYRSRLQRGAPERDDKIPTGENGIMIAALARAGRILGVERYLTAAVNAEEFLRSRLVTPTDLRRYYCHGAAVGDGVLGDYAGYAMGLTELYHCGCGREYLHHGARVMARADALFTDHENGGWFLSRGDDGLPVRPKAPYDGDTPSALCVGLRVLAELSQELPRCGLHQRTKELTDFAASSGVCAYGLTAMMG